LVRVQPEAGGPAPTTPAPNAGRPTGSGGSNSATSRRRFDWTRRSSSVEDALTLEGSRLVTCDNNLNRRDADLVRDDARIQLLGDAK
jgi:hypothetical protein